MTEASTTPKSDTSAPTPAPENPPRHEESGVCAVQKPASRLLERMRRFAPTLAQRYHQRSGE